MAVTRTGEQPDRRVSYRIEQSWDGGLQASIVVGGVARRIALLDTTFAGAGLVAPDGVDLDVGQLVVLRFEAQEMAIPATVRATVRSRSPHGAGIRYGVEFVNPGALTQRLPDRLLGAFNRRRAFRVTPDSNRPIEAVVVREAGNVRIELPVISLSITGAGMFARGTDKQLLMTGDVIHLSFRVPDTSSVCAFVGHVRYSAKQRGGVRYGIEFDAEKTPLFPRQQKVLTRYVMEQQRRMLDTDAA